MKAYGQDCDAIAATSVGEGHAVSHLMLSDITTESMRTAFARYAETHEASSILRLAGLRSEELIGANIGHIRRTEDGAVIQVRGKAVKTASTQSRGAAAGSGPRGLSRHSGRASRLPPDNAPPLGD